jgi:glycosyltransferase involved in cell wall biosynthesis
MNNRIAFLPASNDGCALYRLWLPHLRTSNSKWIPPDAKGLVYYDSFSDCQIGIVQRLASEANYDTIKRMRELGIKIIFDLDDDMWSVQSSNPAKAHLKVFNDYERGFMTCATECNVITVSTNRLKTAVENKLGTKIPIKVIGNAIDPAILRPSPLKKDKSKVIIGWGGSNTHLVDLAQMGKALDIVVENNKQIHLHWVGMAPPGATLKFHERVNSHSWVPVKEYFSRLSTWNWDIGVAPLDNNRFNRSKSSVKMIELGALKIPCLASPVQPYLELTSHNEELKWLLCESEKDWITKLTALVNDEAIRNYYGSLLYNVVMEFYNMEKRAKVWKDAFQLAGA